MKYCSSCGNQMQEGLSFCPNCGAKNNNDGGMTANSASQNSNQNVGGRPRLVEKNIGTAIILSIVTCGIYGIIWFINMVNDVNAVCQDEKSNQSGGTVFLLNIITCGIYGIIWFYQAGQRMKVAGQKYGMEIPDNSTMYLVLAIVGLQIVDYCLIQNDLNKYSVQ